MWTPSGCIFHVLVVFLFISGAHGSVQCMDMNNNPVDWWIMYKVPQAVSNVTGNPYIYNGTGFLYLDVNNKDWVLPDKGMDETNQAFFYTLNQYYKADLSSTFSIMYNDAWPDDGPTSTDLGHTKGFSVFDSSSGFWVIQNIPHFPSNISYTWPSNAYIHGHMAICVSFNYQTLGQLATQWFYNTPYIYQMSLPSKFASDFPVLRQVLQGQTQMQPPYTSVLKLTSKGGQQFTSFAKTGAWGKDLYYDLIAPTLATSLKVETWQHQTNESKNLGGWCSNNNITQVLDATHITLPFGIKFTNYHDHAKFAVAFNPRIGAVSPWVCVGDINRQTHQMIRGGGSLCISDPVLFSTFHTIISAVDKCESWH